MVHFYYKLDETHEIYQKFIGKRFKNKHALNIELPNIPNYVYYNNIFNIYDYDHSYDITANYYHIAQINSIIEIVEIYKLFNYINIDDVKYGEIYYIFIAKLEGSDIKFVMSKCNIDNEIYFSEDYISENENEYEEFIVNLTETVNKQIVVSNKFHDFITNYFNNNLMDTNLLTEVVVE